MVEALLAGFFTQVGKGRSRERINCHHNYSALEVHEGRQVWVT